MATSLLSRPCISKPFQTCTNTPRHVRRTLSVCASQNSDRRQFINDAVRSSAVALAAASLALGSSHALAAPPMQADPYSKDPLEQRKQLQETVGTGEGPSAIANFEGNATLDNPNDSTRPADRSKQQQPLVSAGDKQARLSQFEATKAAAGSVDDSQVDPSYAGPGCGSTKGGN